MSTGIPVRGGRPARSAGWTRRAGIGHSSRWAVLGGFAIAAVLLFVVAPALLSPFRLDLLGKYLATRWWPSASGWPGAAAAC